MTSSTIVVRRSREKNISIFSRPKKPSCAALHPGAHPLRDVESERVSPQRFWSASQATDSGRHDPNAPRAARR